MTDDLLTHLLTVFRKEYGPAILGAHVTYLPSEAFIAIIVTDPTELIYQLAQALKAECEELDHRVHIQIRT